MGKYIDILGDNSNEQAIILAPGQTSFGNKYATWAEVATVLAQSYGQTFVYVDDRAVAPAAVAIDANVTINDRVKVITHPDIAKAKVEIADGVVLTDLVDWQGIGIKFLGNTSRIAVVNSQRMDLDFCDIETASASASPIQVSSGVLAVNLSSNTHIKLNGYEVFQVDGGASLIMTVGHACKIDDDAIRGAGFYQLIIEANADKSGVQLAKPTNLTGTFDGPRYGSKSKYHDYDTSDAALYPEAPAGSTTESALDVIANRTVYRPYVIDYSGLNPALSVETIVLESLPGNFFVDHPMISVGTGFTGGTITGITMEMGEPANSVQYMAPVDISVSGNTIQQASMVPVATGSPTNIEVTVRSTGGNFGQLSAGSLVVWIKTNAG